MQPEHPYPRDIASLTSLRFFAALAVVLHHYEWELPTYVAPLPGHFEKGYLAVDFFFILSGFVLAHVYKAGIEAGQFKPGSFLVKRFARIYPMHLLTLLFYGLLAFAALEAGLHIDNPERYGLAYFFSHLFLVNGWTNIDHGTFNGPAWSVSAEWFAYLCFAATAPWLFRAINRCGPIAAVAVSFGLLTALYVFSPALLGAAYGDLHSNFGFVRVVPTFLLGVSLYAFGLRLRLPVIGHRWSVVLLFLAAIGGVVIGAPDPAIIALLAVAILAAAEQARHRTSTVLECRSLRTLGDASYSLYMVHAPVGTLLFTGWEMAVGPVSLPVVITVLAAAITVSLASYRWIEIPARNQILRRSLGRLKAA
jgi:peptidoglycan/LPS O-acetylase OafA/YrhL